MLYLGILGSNFEKLFEINTPEFVKHEFLTNTISFGKGSTFSTGPGSNL